MNPEERITKILEMLKASPDDSFLLFALAKEWEKKGELARCLALYQRLLEGDPNYVGAYYHLGKLQEALDRHEDALRSYSTGMEVARKTGDLHAFQELAAARLNLADPDDAPV